MNAVVREAEQPFESNIGMLAGLLIGVSGLNGVVGEAVLRIVLAQRGEGEQMRMEKRSGEGKRQRGPIGGRSFESIEKHTMELAPVWSKWSLSL